MRTQLVVLAVLLASAAPVGAQTLTFSNQTAAAGIDVKYLPGSFTSSEYIAGCACGDFNADGYQDLFLPSGGGTNGMDRLYINQGDGTFVDDAGAWGIAPPHYGLALAVADYDDDGYLDLFEASNGIGQNKLYHNVAGASFTNDAATAGLAGLANDSFGASFGDYDLDGDLDIFVTGFNSHKNRLFQNQGNGTYINVSTAAGLFSPTSSVFGFATRFVDMNGDRYPELLISGDFGTSRYFKNNGDGTFTNFTAASGCGKDENGMGGTAGDFNRDGLIDWYVTSIKSTQTAGWTGNKLYQNNGAHTFTEISQTAGVWNGNYGWGAVAVDFNHDGWLDIGETNGAQWSAEYLNKPSYLWMNNGDGTYTESSVATGFIDYDQGRGMLNFDYDLDGDQDIVITGNDEKAKLWRNDLSGSNIHWLRIVLDTSAKAGLSPSGYGSVVRVTANGIQRTGVLSGGDNLQSQSELTVHFGLGAETLASEVRVEWEDGTVTTLENVAADQTLTIAAEPAVWTDLGSGLAGTSGIPQLAGTGTLVGGSFGTLDLTLAKPSTACQLEVSLASLPAPFKGGVLVAFPPLIGIPLGTLADGTLPLPFVWPVGLPSGTNLWFQYLISDGAAVKGVALSNALKATTP
jgi:hypothetical protein